MRRSWTVVLAMGVALSPRGAEASCLGPENPRIVWSYPADGDVVPSNIERVFVRSDSTKQVFLNSTPLERSAGGYALPPLAPSTSYELTVEMFAATSGDAGYVESVVSDTLAFETDTGPLSDPPPEVPVVVGHVVSQDPGDGTCATILHAGSCYDTGESTRLSFVLEGSTFLWQLEGNRTFPASACDGPAIYGHEEDLMATCYVVNAIDRAGRMAPSASYCPGTAADSGVSGGITPSASPDAGGCTLAGRSAESSAETWLAVSAFALAARRWRGRRTGQGDEGRPRSFQP